MRNKLLLALIGMAAMFTGCSQEAKEDFAASKTTSFNVSVDGGVKTRADVTDLTRYVMEVYKGATATGTPVMHKEQATGVFTDVVLDNTEKYTVLFWADYGTPTAQGAQPSASNEYNTADLKAAFIAKQPTQAAYAGLSRFTAGTDNEADYTTVTLKHAVAQVNFKQTEVLTSATNTLVVNYPKSYSLNVDNDAMTEIAGKVTHTFTYNSKEIGTLGTSYLIAATGTPKTLLDITVKLNNEAMVTLPNVPFQRNARTNIVGSLSCLYDASLTVTCDEAWETTDNEASITPPAPADPNVITVNGIKVATGNLVSDGEGGAKMGTATDCGLYFQFGSLIGWSGGANGDGTGTPLANVSLEVKVVPSGYTGKTSWNRNWTGALNPGTDPDANDEAAGTGDPCRYYLKGTWRLPTKEEFNKLFNTDNYTYQNGWSWDSTSSSASHSSGLKFPASNTRNYNEGNLYSVGSEGCYWSALLDSGINGCSLSFSSSRLYPSSANRRSEGLPVRCVQDASN